MTVIQKQESGLVPMEANNPHDPPPSYSYTPLSRTTSSMPVTPATSPPLSPQPRPNAKTVLAPQPITPVPVINTVPRTEDRRPVMMNVLKERQPLSTCDSRFADLILTQAILPRLRVGVLKWKDRETFEYIPQTKDDKKHRIRRTKWDDSLGFLASEYTFRFHNVEALVADELSKAGFRVKKVKISEKDKKWIVIKWRLKEPRGRRGQQPGCCA